MARRRENSACYALTHQSLFGQIKGKWNKLKKTKRNGKRRRSFIAKSAVHSGPFS
jgi:hypothetical protein